MREKLGTSLRKTIGKRYRDHFRGSKTLNPKRREKKLGLLFYSYWLISLDAKKNIFPLTLLFRRPFCLREFDRWYLLWRLSIILCIFLLLGNFEESDGKQWSIMGFLY
jgi:hypothetical protein